MLQNYLKIALRMIRKQMGYALINIAGLAFGMACTMLIMMWVQDELSYNNFHEHGDDIYRVNLKNIRPEGTEYIDWVHFPLAEALKAQYPEVVERARFRREQIMFQVGDHIYTERQVTFVDPAYFDMFSYPLDQMNPDQALPGIESLIIRDDVVEKYFGTENPLGKTMTLNNKEIFVVTGIVHIPRNSDFQTDFFLPFTSYVKFNQTFSKDMDTNWGIVNYHAFVLLRKGSDPVQLEEKIADIINENQNNTGGTIPTLQRLDEIYLYNADGSGSRVVYVYSFSLIGLFILGIACINFMNLSTARSEMRSKEVGLRKTLGATRPQLIKQFLTESILISVWSFIIAVGIVWLVLPAFNNLTEKALAIDLFNMNLILGMLSIALLTGLIAGSYPALVLSGFQPYTILRGTSGRGVNLRKALVICQFALSIILIICTIIVFTQIEYIKNRDLGYSKENIVYISMEGESSLNTVALKKALLQHPDIHSASRILQLPVSNNSWMGEPSWEGREEGNEVRFAFQIADFDFVRTFNIDMAMGRDFSREMGTDVDNYLINEEAVRRMGLTDPIGKWFDFWGRKGQIIGVVKDFNYRQLDQKIAPLVISPAPWGFAIANTSRLAIKINPGNPTEALTYFESTWYRMNPGYAFEYRFLDDTYNQLYQSTRRLEQILLLFTVLAILISSLGLFGLAIFNADQRSREIGIRKVLGASSLGLVVLLSSDFSKLVIVANIIAWPVAWYTMDRWLGDFAYRTDIDISFFLLSAVMALGIAWTTVGYQAYKTANSNPINALRNRE